jgi:hypothetical protein
VSDEPTTLPPSVHGGPGSGPPDRRSRFRRALVRFAATTAVLTVVAVGAGIVLGRTQPDRGARLVVREFVVVEDAVGVAPGPVAVTPTSGSARGVPACGVLIEPLDADEQVATLASGVVLLQHGPAATDADRRTLEELAARGRVAVAPNPDLSDAVVATAWRHRMPLDRGRPELLDAFVTGHADRAPDVRPCAEGPATSR